jgi:Fic family protein
VGLNDIMVYFAKKKINGKQYLYAIHSVRLSNGKISKIMKKVKNAEITKELQEFFDERQKNLLQNDALNKYKIDSIFTKEQIEKVEATKTDYKKILKKLSRAQKKDLLDRFTANFTYESNAIEGNSLTLKDVAMILFEGKVLEGKELREIFETRNSRKVVDLILANKFKVTENNIIKMHKMLVEDMGIKTGYKQIPNYLVGRKIETTPPEDVAKEMKELVKWFNEEKNIHPIKKAALLHGKFEKIHPFDDGNGRVGRFLINVTLINNGFAPLIIRKSQRIAYLKSLEDFDNNYTKNLERFLLDKYKNTFKNFFEVYTKYLK